MAPRGLLCARPQLGVARLSPGRADDGQRFGWPLCRSALDPRRAVPRAALPVCAGPRDLRRDGEAFSHADYMRWRQVRGQYPGYSTDPIDGFRHLAADLNGAAAQLLSMTKSELVEGAGGIRSLPPPGLP